LEGFRVYEDDLQGKDCLIVDDICDGGGTFIGLAKELKKHNAGNLYLSVSHGIFSKGLKELNQYFTNIFTTDSFKTIDEGVEQIELKGLIK
jgi:ribose-phosphate pyrophosphokinase